jgi:type VI secretion system secreted protein VgrG
MSQAAILEFKSTDPFEYYLELRQKPYLVREARGSEGISRLYRFELTYRTKPGEVPDPVEFVGNEAILRVQRTGVDLRYLVGMISESSLEATATGDPELRVVIEPRLALMRHRRDHRVFRDMTVPQIVAHILRENGIDTILRLRETYKIRAYTVMYGETVLDFVQRLLEEEGIFYFFPEWVDPDARPELAETLHGVVLGDGSHACEPVDGDTDIQLRATAGLARQSESVFAVKHSAKMRPGKVSLRDWNLEKPSAPMDVSADLPRFDADTVHGPEVYLYPGRYEVPAEGQRFARLMAESYACNSSRITGKSDTARLMTGRTITMIPDQELVGMATQEVLILALHHQYARGKEGEAGGTQLEVAFEAQPAEISFRPPRVTPSPKITNPLIAHVTGPEGEDIHTDTFGRVKIHFPWDRHQAKDDNASHWVPVMQENTGTSAGIPRIGWETVVGFVAGDPDRPFVLGRVYNGKDLFPEPLPANKTKSALRSLSSPSRDGHNEIFMEDAAGREIIAIQAERDKNVVVARNKKEDVQNLEENTVVKDETINIGANQTVTVKKQQITAVDGNQSITVAASRTRKVKAADQVTVAGSRTVNIGSVHLRTIGGFDNTSEKKTLSETTGGAEIEVSLKANETNASMLQTLTVGGAVVEIAGQGKEEKVELLRVETVGAMLITAVKEQFALKALKKRATKIGATLLAKAKTMKIASDDAEVKVSALGTAELKGTTQIKLEVGGSSVLLSADGIVIKSSGTVEIAATTASDLLSKKADIL